VAASYGMQRAASDLRRKLAPSTPDLTGIRALSCRAAHARLRGADFLAAWIPFSIQTNVAADKFRVGMLRIQFVCLVWSFWRLMEFFRYPSL
jgi:hypothetical protein